jgi:hypothetical protein
MQGKRIENPDNGLADPGEYWKDVDGTWYGITPNGLYGWFRNHHVEEHEDGTISVLPGGGGSSNSILCSNGTTKPRYKKQWHGYIRDGVWEEC